MWARASQVEKEIVICSWRLNSVFNARRVGKRATEKERGKEKKVKAVACGPLTCQIQHDSIWTNVFFFLALRSSFQNVFLINHQSSIRRKKCEERSHEEFQSREER